MQTATLSFLITLAIVTQSESRNPTPQQEVDYQRQTFQQWWGQDLTMRLDDLPTEGSVPDFRVPYSGHDYPDRGGGTMAALSKYDMAYNGGRRLAMEYERRDVGAHRGRTFEPGQRVGLFGRIRLNRAAASNSRSWYGHCNGWTAAAIRHAEPVYSVTRNGVTFTPADIKGLLAEIYMYTDTEFLGGVDAVIHPALLHLTLANWVGKGSHPVGVETAVGEVVINYPIYRYKASVTKHRENLAEVKLTAVYAMNTNHEMQKSPRIPKQMYFHYELDLDNEGNIAGGRYYNDSSRIDMLWTALKPIQGGQKGNERGNPYVNVKEVLAIWRASVPESTRTQWLNIDPTEEDRILSEEDKIALAKEKEAREKEELEKAAKAKEARAREAAEKAAKEKEAREKIAQEKAAKEQAAREKLAQEKAAREKLAQEKAAKENEAREKLASEKAAKEKALAEKALAEKALAEKAATEKSDTEKAAKEATEKEKKKAETPAQPIAGTLDPQ